jgi:hypothetical protein
MDRQAAPCRVRCVLQRAQVPVCREPECNCACYSQSCPCPHNAKHVLPAQSPHEELNQEVDSVEEAEVEYHLHVRREQHHVDNNHQQSCPEEGKPLP